MMTQLLTFSIMQCNAALLTSLSKPLGDLSPLRVNLLSVNLLGDMTVSSSALKFFLIFGYAGSLLQGVFSCTEQGLLSSCREQASHCHGFFRWGP